MITGEDAAGCEKFQYVYYWSNIFQLHSGPNARKLWQKSFSNSKVAKQYFTMLGAGYRCTLCTFRSYTFGTLQAHCKLFHHELNLSKQQHHSKLHNPKNHPKEGYLLSKGRRHGAFKCPYCKHTSKQRGNLRTHIISCHTNNPRRFKCHKCASRSPSICRLKHHLMSHFVRKFKCRFCSYTATISATIYKHTREVHIGLTKFQCYLCQARFKRPSHLQRHIKSHSSAPVSCKICNKEYLSKETLNQHMRTHSNKVLSANCTICHKSFTGKQNLQSHIMLQHTFRADIKRWGCVICKLSFRNNSTLTSHMQQKHSEWSKKKQKFKCQTCSTVYLSKVGLIYHINRKHTNVPTQSEPGCTT